MTYAVKHPTDSSWLARPRFVGDAVRWIPLDYSEGAERPWEFDTRRGAERARDMQLQKATVLELPTPPQRRFLHAHDLMAVIGALVAGSDTVFQPGDGQADGPFGFEGF